MGQGMNKERYLLLDSRNAPLARALLESPMDAPSWQIRVLDDKMDTVLEHEVVQLVGMSDGAPALTGRIIRSRRDIIVVEKLGDLKSEIRENLRMPIRFESLIYPLTGSWKGRRKVRGNDLSCGGISFYCEDNLENGEQLEVVIPITTQPLVLRCQVLRQRPSNRSGTLYAAKFVDMCNDEETLVREAVFNVQLQTRGPRTTQ